MNRSQLEIEIPRRWVYITVGILISLALTLLGLSISPTDSTGKPLLLSPRLAGVGEYRRAVRGWVASMRSIDQDLGLLLQDKGGDLLERNERISRAYAQIELAVEDIDQAQIPTTFEPVHDLVEQTARTYLDAVSQTAQWIGEPSEANYQLAQDGVASARELLNRLEDNPWIEVKP